MNTKTIGVDLAKRVFQVSLATGLLGIIRGSHVRLPESVAAKRQIQRFNVGLQR